MSWERKAVRALGAALLLVAAVGLGLVIGTPGTASAQEDTSTTSLLEDTTSTTLADTTTSTVADTDTTIVDDSTDMTDESPADGTQRERPARGDHDGDHDCGDRAATQDGSTTQEGDVSSLNGA